MSYALMPVLVTADLGPPAVADCMLARLDMNPFLGTRTKS